MRKFVSFAAVSVLLAASATFAHAVPIVGTIVADTGVESYTGQTTFTAITREVVFTDTSNAFAGCSNNCLTFVFALQDQTGNAILTASLGDFSSLLSTVGGAALSISGLGSAGSVAPTSIMEDINGVYNFTFSPGLLNGQESELLYVQTNAKTFIPGSLGAIDSSGGTAAGFVGSPVPEPNSLMLLGSGLFGAAGMFFRRRVTA